MSHVFSAPVRFGHCDPAGIAYFPRLFELVDEAIEDWTADAIGVGRAEMHGPMRLGLPTVDLHAGFTVPCRLGELLDIDVEATALGTTSIDLCASASVAGARRFTVRLTQVLMNLDTARPVPWPEAWRARLS